MKLTKKPIHYLAMTALASALSAGPTLAMADTKSAKKQDAMRDWAEMRAEAVPADEILAGDIRNRFNQVGRTEDLILNTEGTAVQYVLFEVPYPYSFYATEDGFVNYSAVDLDDDYSGGVNLVIKDADVGLPRDQLTLTRGEARNRLVSRLIGSDVKFSDGAVREVDDILVHPQTGKVTHYVVEMNPQALIDEDLRTVRASKVTIKDDGSLAVDMKAADVDKSQDYDPQLL